MQTEWILKGLAHLGKTPATNSPNHPSPHLPHFPSLEEVSR